MILLLESVKWKQYKTHQFERRYCERLDSEKIEKIEGRPGTPDNPYPKDLYSVRAEEFATRLLQAQARAHLYFRRF